MSTLPVIDWKKSKSFVENQFTKYGQQMEEKAIKVFNYPNRTLNMVTCPLCKECHTKPKSYTGRTYLPDDKLIKPSGMGTRLARRDIPSIDNPVSQQEINQLLAQLDKTA